MRPQRRRLTRRRFRRIGPPDAAAESVPETVPAPADAPAAVPPRPMRCMCGTILEIAADDHGARKSCSTCRRRFEVQIAYDLTAGRNDISIHYLTEKNVRTGETCIIGSTTTDVTLPSVGRKAAARPLEPEPPQEALHKCSCGVLLLVRKKHYESRVRCPECDARWMMAMLFDPVENSFSLQTFSLADPSSGTTQVLTKL
jgi:DNA-directed RNA polymerase subunit M/transcription elongation factor TFIIS